MGISEDKKVLLFLYFDIDQCWSGTVHYSFLSQLFAVRATSVN